MTRSHEPLIRLARFKVEELQKQMAELDRSRQALIDQIERLEASVPEEQAVAAESKEGFLAYGSYAQAVICLLYTSPSPRDLSTSRMPSSA